LELPVFPVPEKPAPSDAEEKGEKTEAEAEQPSKIQRTETSRVSTTEQCKFFANGSCKYGSSCRLSHTEPVEEGDLPPFSEEDKQTSGTVFVDIAWIVIYNARTGLSVCLPSTGNNIPTKFVEAARETEFSKTCGTLISDQLSSELDTKINPVDPHKMLNAGVISRGHLLEQALTVGFAQLTHKEMARKRVVAVARAKELAAQRAAAKEEAEKEQARKREEAEEKARQDALEKAAAEEKAAAAAAAAAAAEAAAAAAAPAEAATSMETAESAEPVVVHTDEAQKVVAA